jgi:hypothetical protein
VLFIIVLFAAPAMAVDWNFYGNARMATFWIDDDFGDGEDAAGNNDDEGLQWELQSNSRIGATVKADAVTGRFELGLKGSDGGDNLSNRPGDADDNDIDVGTRRIEATWDFGPAELSLGKGYTPANQFLSGQVFAGDAGLLGNGFAYAGRPGYIALGFGGFKVALITPKTDTVDVSVAGSQDEDVTIPKIEAGFGMSFDMFNFNVFGGYQTYEIEVDPAVGSDFDVDSYVVGGDVGVNFGPGYVKAGISYGENGGNARWAMGSGTVNADDDDIDDNETLQAAIVAGWKFTDMISLEGGFGYREDDSDAPGTDEDKTYAYYLQSVINMAPGVFLIPEIGYYDFDDDAAGDDEGEQFYIGAKWQINF